MQRRRFLKSLGMLAGALLVAPKAIAEAFKKKPPLDNRTATEALSEAEFQEFIAEAFRYGSREKVMYLNPSSKREWRKWFRRNKTRDYNTPHGTIRIL